jgi:hypothetical protein
MASGHTILAQYFRVKYVGCVHDEHLMECIKKNITFPAKGMEVLTAA